MPLKHLSLGWYGQNMKAISYVLNPSVWCGRTESLSYIMHTFQNLNTAVNDKV